MYSYISTGDLQAALLHVSAVNVCDPTLKTVDINYVRMYISQPYIRIATSQNAILVAFFILVLIVYSQVRFVL